MPYNFAADSFHTKKLCSRLSSSEVRFFTEIGRLAFLRPPSGNLGATHDDHFRLIENCVVDFLLALIELFSLGVTAEALRAIFGSKSAILLQRGPVELKFQVEGIAPYQPFFFSVNLVLSQSTRVTDRRTEFSSLYRVCITCSAVKSNAQYVSDSDYDIIINQLHKVHRYFLRCLLNTVIEEHTTVVQKVNYSIKGCPYI